MPLPPTSTAVARVMLKWRVGIREMLATVRKLAKEEAIANGELPMDGKADNEDEDEGEDGSEDGSGSEVNEVLTMAAVAMLTVWFAQDELDKALAEANLAIKSKHKRQRRLKAKGNRKLREKIALQVRAKAGGGDRQQMAG